MWLQVPHEQVWTHARSYGVLASTPFSQATRLLLMGPPLKVTLRARIRSKASLVVGDIHVADRGKKRKPGFKSHVYTAHESDCNVWVHLTFNDAVVPVRSRPPFRNSVNS